MTTNHRFGLVGTIFLMAIFVASAASAGTYSIPTDRQDATQIYCGSASSFSAPAEVDFEAVVKATDEFAEIKRKKVPRGTAEYWILLDRANQRAAKVIREFHGGSMYDLIAAEGHLGQFNLPVVADDVTRQVVELLRG